MAQYRDTAMNSEMDKAWRSGTYVLVSISEPSRTMFPVLDAIMWLSQPDHPGHFYHTYAYRHLEALGDGDFQARWFLISDPDVAFAFRMRWT